MYFYKMNNREFVSRVKNQLRMVNKDDHLNNRFILFVGENIAKSYLAKKIKDRSLYRNSDLYITIPCFEMESVDAYQCDIVAFRNCHNLMKSVKPLPELINTSYGSSLKTVTSIDGEYFFEKSTINQFKRNKNREILDNDINYFYEIDGYLYITGVEVEVVELYLLTQDGYDANELCGCSGDSCQSAWDYDFIINDDLLENVVRETVQQVLISRQLTEDENPNLDSNQKTQTV